MVKQRTWRVATTGSTYAITSNNDNNNTNNNDNDTDNDTNNNNSTNGAAAHVARGCRWLQFDIVFIAVRNEIASRFLTIFDTKSASRRALGHLGASLRHVRVARHLQGPFKTGHLASKKPPEESPGGPWDAPWRHF